MDCAENPRLLKEGESPLCEYLSKQPSERVCFSRDVSGAPVTASEFCWAKFLAELVESVLCEEAENRGGTAVLIALCRKAEGVFAPKINVDEKE